MAVPFALGRIIDIIYTNDQSKMRENLNKLCASLTVVFFVGALCNFGRVYLMNLSGIFQLDNFDETPFFKHNIMLKIDSGQKITKTLREKVFKSIISQETAFFDKHRTGELINRLSADTSLVSQSVTMNISDGLRSSIMVAAGVSMMVIFLNQYIELLKCTDSQTDDLMGFFPSSVLYVSSIGGCWSNDSATCRWNGCNLWTIRS